MLRGYYCGRIRISIVVMALFVLSLDLEEMQVSPW